MSEHTWGQGEEVAGVVRCHVRGLEAVRAESALGSVVVFRQGAHVSEYVPQGAEPVLWTSEQSRFQLGAAIRGGIPLCFPWFGAHATKPELPAHGFARTSLFTYLGSQSLADGALRVAFALESDERTHALFPHSFRAELAVTLAAQLKVVFSVENTGAEPLAYEEALHSYFAVGDVRRIEIAGLAGASYADKVSSSEALERVELLRIDSETDRVYRSKAPTTLVDPALGRRIAVGKAGSETTVVWNPWIDKARRMTDFGDDEYLGMVCIESANTHADRVALAPGECHSLELLLGCERL